MAVYTHSIIRRFRQNPDCVFALDLGDLQFLRERYTVNGNPTVVNSPWGHALSFDGTNDGIDLEINPFYSTAITEMSFCIAFKLSETQENAFGRFFHFDFSGNARIQAWPNNDGANGIQGRFQDDNSNPGGNFSLCDSSDINDGEWHTAVMGVDGTNFISYLDGDPDIDSNKGYNTTFSLNDMHIGESGIGANEFKGTIAWIIVYKRMLSADEANNLHYNKVF